MSAPPGFEVVNFASADDMLAALDQRPGILGWNTRAHPLPGHEGYIFRGQRDAQWGLVPRVFREDFSWQQFTTQQSFCTPELQAPENPGTRRCTLAWTMYLELRVVREFMERADNLGLAPGAVDYTAFDGAHANDITQFKQGRHGSGPSEFPRSDLLDHFALAQHYGTPTRLLDFTESYLVAAFFAAYGAWHKRQAYETLGLEWDDGQAPTDIAIFLVRVPAISRLRTGGNLDLVRSSRSTNDFIRAQRGLFVNMPTANWYFLQSGAWPTLDQFIGSQGAGGETQNALRSFLPKEVKKLTMPGEEVPRLLALLLDRGVSPMSVKPSLENAAREGHYRRLISTNV